MRKKGIIYQHGGPASGTIYLKKSWRGVFAGSFFGGCLGLLILFSPLLYQEAEFRVRQMRSEKVVVADLSKGETFGDLIKEQHIRTLSPIDTAFSLVIPKINLNSKIVANVDPSDKSDYLPALKIGAAHAAGSSLPGEGGKIYLFAHSTDYIWHISQFNAIFYLLKELKNGDEVNIFYAGRRYIYQVSNTKIVQPEETVYLKPEKGEEVLLLQTCWPPGTTWRRLLVFAKPVSVL